VLGKEKVSYLLEMTDCIKILYSSIIILTDMAFNKNGREVYSDLQSW
jgi:hypothetical protein